MGIIEYLDSEGRISIPKELLEVIGINVDNADVTLKCEGQRIVISGN